MVCLPSNQNGCGLKLVAGCVECVASASQSNPTAAVHAPEGTVTHLGSASSSTRGRGKKRPRTFSGGLQGNLSNTLGPKIATVRHRAKAKGKQAQKTSLWDADPSPEETPDISSQEYSDQQAEPRMFIECRVHHLADYICF